MRSDVGRGMGSVGEGKGRCEGVKKCGRVYRVSGKVCWGVGEGKGRCGGCKEVWESVWGECGKCVEVWGR